MTTTQTSNQTKTGRGGRKRGPRYNIAEDLLRDIVQNTHRFDSKAEHSEVFVKEASEFPAFVVEALTYFFIMHYHKAVPARPSPVKGPANAAMEAEKVALHKSTFSLALVNCFLNSKLISGKLAAESDAPALRANGGVYYKLAKLVPRGKVLRDVAESDEQKIAISAILRPTR